MKKSRMDDKEYGKKHIVFAVIQKFIDEKNKDVPYDLLKKIFPDYLQGSYGILKNNSDYNELTIEQKSDRYFDDVLETKYDKIHISTEWGDDTVRNKGNIRPFIEYVNNTLNYNIEILDENDTKETQYIGTHFYPKNDDLDLERYSYIEDELHLDILFFDLSLSFDEQTEMQIL